MCWVSIKDDAPFAGAASEWSLGHQEWAPEKDCGTPVSLSFSSRCGICSSSDGTLSTPISSPVNAAWPVSDFKPSNCELSKHFFNKLDKIPGEKKLSFRVQWFDSFVNKAVEEKHNFSLMWFQSPYCLCVSLYSLCHCLSLWHFCHKVFWKNIFQRLV